MRILIADDHQLIREGVKRLLANAGSGTHVGEARGADEVFASMADTAWDLVILDINLPGKNGLEILKELRQQYPSVPVLMLSMYPEDQFAVRVMKAGAAGYINKGSAAEELLLAVQKVAAGGKYISDAVAERLADAIDSGAREPHHRLSDREFEVFKLIASGKTVGEIALALERSVKTVSTHRAHILRKMHLQNNAEIMQYALAHGLAE